MWRVRHQGLSYRLLPGAQWSVGRDPACDIVLAAPAVSRRHAILEAGHDACVVRDAGSRNGIVVNGVAVDGARIDAESWVQVGSEVLIVGPDPGEVAAPPRRARPSPLAGQRTLVQAGRLELMVAACEGLLLAGRPHEARDAGRELLDAVRKHGPDAGEDLVGRMASCLARLTRALRQPEIVLHLVELHRLTRRIPEEEAIGAIESTLPRSKRVRRAVAELVRDLRAHPLGFADGVRLRRLQSMTSLANS